MRGPIRSLLGLAVLAGAALALVTSAAGSSRAAASSFDAHWLRSGARADIFLIASARMAVAHAVDPSLRSAAQELVDDQLRLLGRRRALARTLKVPLPRRADPVQTLEINQLAAVASDAALFEPLVARSQAAALQLAVLDAAEAARGAASPAVRKLARAVLPVLKEHFRTLVALGR